MTPSYISIAQATAAELQAPGCPAEPARPAAGCAARSGARPACERRCVDRRAALAAARRAVSALDGRDGPTLELVHAPGGAALPLLRSGGTPDFTLTLSHSRGRAVAAAAEKPARIGIDLERMGRITADHTRYFTDPEERAAGIDPTMLWALKEAAWKAVGLSSDTPFLALVLELRQGALTAVRVNGTRFEATSRVWSPWPGWTAALVELEPRATRAMRLEAASPRAGAAA
jgi:phosphopantetheinyl transferase